jgi:WD40 repeat protein
MTGGDTREGWDFFLSYTQADRVWAEWIAWVLEEDGHRVLIQAWDFVPGTNWILGMQAGIEKSTRTIAVLSADYLASVYGSAEWQAAYAADPSGTRRKLLVVRVADCSRPKLLAGVVGVDLFGLDDADATVQLRAMVSGALLGRAKPAVKPKFPGASRAVPREPEFPGSPDGGHITHAHPDDEINTTSRSPAPSQTHTSAAAKTDQRSAAPRPTRLARTLTGHQAVLRGTAFSPDGALLATASYDLTARLWDLATGRAARTLTGHEAGVYKVAFSPDGALLATASYDRTARLWDPATGRAARTLTGHEGAVLAVAFSPDDALLATASEDKTARLWDLATGQCIRTLIGHAGPVVDVAFSPDGALLATASDDKTARLWS